MRNRYNKQLELLHNELVSMGELCDTAISLAIKALADDDITLIDKVFETDSEIDEMERTIEGLCMKLLLQQQPVASDLREISSALKMISDMERIGDQASDIAEIAKIIIGRKSKGEDDLELMAAESVKMVKDSVRAFVEKDEELANKVIKYDDIVDDWFDRIKAELIMLITGNNDDGEYLIDLLMIAKYLERIGDHATNIAEWVIYSITGIHKKD